MKPIVSLLVLINFTFFAKSQGISSFKAFDIGAGMSMNSVAGDAEASEYTKAINLNLNYNFSPYINIVGELQFGSLAGGNAFKDLSGRQFQNNFKTIGLRAQLQIGAFTGGEGTALKNLYLGAGAGFIDNDIKSINRQSFLLVDFPETPGVNNSVNTFIPVRLGYEAKVQNSYGETLFKVDLAYQHNFILGDEVNGFTTGKYKDTFSQLNLGIKVCAFGRHWKRGY